MFEIIVKKRKTKKNREKQIKVNPPGKKGTKKNRKQVELIEVDEEQPI